MISIRYGVVSSVKAPRVSVELYGYGDSGVLEGLPALMPGGQGTNGRSWFPLRVGDSVAVLFDDAQPVNSLVLGGVYGDGDTVATGAPSVGIEADALYLKCGPGKFVTSGSDLDGAQYASRDDRVQSELRNIKAALNLIVGTFNGHVHSINLVGAESSAAIVASASSGAPAITQITTIPPLEAAENIYDVGTSRAESVKIY